MGTYPIPPSLSFAITGCLSAGKSTLANHLLAWQPQFVLLSADNIRSELHGDWAYAPNALCDKRVYKKMLYAYLQATKASKPCLFDATGLAWGYQRILSDYRHELFRIHLICNRETWKRREQTRKALKEERTYSIATKMYERSCQKELCDADVLLDTSDMTELDVFRHVTNAWQDFLLHKQTLKKISFPQY
jgi:predicted kinase